jgi:preprotein translocase subunit SecD
MNQYPLWKNLLILLIVIVGVIYALPNLYGESPALQITAPATGAADEALEKKVRETLSEAKLQPVSVERHDRQMLVRFKETESQLKANDVVAAALGSDYVVALHLAPSTPKWLRAIGAQPMYLGLDLRGGVHFLLEVDMDAAVRQAEERFVTDMRTTLREKRIHYKAIKRLEGGGIHAGFRDTGRRDEGEKIIKDAFSELTSTREDQVEEFGLRLQLKEKFIRETRGFALQQNLTTLRNRVNELGVAEPVIQQQGDNRVVVQLPGVQDTARAKEILGATATLEFRMVDVEHDVQEATAGKVPVNAKLYKSREGEPLLLKKQVMLTGEYIIDAASTIDQASGGPAVSITLDGKGGRIFSHATKDNVGRPMAVVFIENKNETQKQGEQMVKVKKTVEEVINVATIREQLSNRFQITGLDNTEEARNLALLLRAGALAAPMDIVEERTVGPSLGQENIDMGFRSVVIGFALVVLYMGVYYKLFGVVANLALALNLVLTVALMSLIQATLTLPGIAGLILTVGMAVDANVLINERIREELRNGNSPQSSINAGYERAFSAIADSNITTLIAAVVLFGLGTGPVKGFAVTLTLGLLTSMFTAIMCTRAVVNLVYGGKRRAKLSI